jgi:cobalt-zinc-cadmium efflux system outer membrane protein
MACVRAAVTATWLLAVGVFAVGSAEAQSPADLTVEELVARAISDSPELRAARVEIDAAVGRLRQAGLRPNPMLELGGQKALSPDNNVMIGLSVPLDLNGRKDGRVGVAERELEMKRAQVRDRERRLAADIRMKAGDLMAARRNVTVTDDLLRINHGALRLVRERVRQGATPALEENLMLVEVNRLEATRQMLGSRVEITTLQLKALAGIAPDVPLSIRGQLASTAAIPEAAEAAQHALASRPDLAVARNDVAMGTAKIRKEQAEARWDASVNVGYQRQNFGFDLNGLTSTGATRPIQDVFHYFGAGVSIMLPVRNRNDGNIAAAEAEARAAELRLEFAELTVRKEISAAFAQHAAARRSLDIYERGVRDVATRNLDVVRQAYGLGRSSLLDVIAEQRRYIEVENGYTDILKQVYDAAVEIARATGGTTWPER